MEEKLKILAAGDFHGDSSLAERLANQADKEKVSLVILNGDIVEDENPITGVIGPFLNKNKKVIIIPGNHESPATAEFLKEHYNIFNLHGYYMIYKNVGIFGCGGANVGLTQVTDEEMIEILKRGFEKVKHAKTKVMVTHIHPAGTAMEKFSRFVTGSKGLTKAIYELQPDIVVCGHVHEAEGIEEKLGKTRVINVGKKGRILEV